MMLSPKKKLKVVAITIGVLAFIGAPSIRATAADVTPFHVVSSSQESVILDLDNNITAPTIVSVFGKHGWSTATLKEVAEKCEYLCGEDHEAGKECHNEGIYLLNKNTSHGSLRGPLVAIEGTVRIESTKEQIKFKESQHQDDSFVSKEFSRGYRWDKDEKSGKTYLFSEYMGPKGVGSKDWYAPPISLDSCSSKTFNDFDILGCSGVTMLYHQKELIELSMAEYSSGNLDLMFSVRINDKTYYAIEVSVKGHGQRLKLITKEGKKWMGFFRTPTYAAMC